jgi:hypothetical protein
MEHLMVSISDTIDEGNFNNAPILRMENYWTAPCDRTTMKGCFSNICSSTKKLLQKTYENFGAGH